MWLVGTGQVMPNMEKTRSDTPKPLQRLMLDCIQHSREKRPLFPQVLNVVEHLMRTMPKIHRSLSEPILNRPVFHSEDLAAGSGGNTGGGSGSPKTPVSGTSVLA